MARGTEGKLQEAREAKAVVEAWAPKPGTSREGGGRGGIGGSVGGGGTGGRQPGKHSWDDDDDDNDPNKRRKTDPMKKPIRPIIAKKEPRKQGMPYPPANSLHLP